MIQDPAARRYAQAVFELAEERGAFDEWLEDLDALAAAFSEPVVARALASQRIPPDRKEALIRQAAPDLRPLSWNLVRLLIRKNRLHLLPQIAEALRELIDERRGVAKAIVTTAVPLDEADRQRVAERLSQITGKQVVVETRVDESIMGGLVARIGDRLIDGSTRTKLLALRAALEGKER